jgi:hypothetical protein
VDRAAADWWRRARAYQVYIRSFTDSNGDGVGDIAEIRSRLPYLKGLGVDADLDHAAVPVSDGRWRPRGHQLPPSTHSSARSTMLASPSPKRARGGSE